MCLKYVEIINVAEKVFVFYKIYEKDKYTEDASGIENYIKR